jgi:hypothetical protein
MDFSAILALGIPALVAVMVAGSIAHAWAAAKKLPPEQPLFRPKVGIICVLHLLCAGGVYRLLITGGWLTNHYRWDDPDDFNLVLAIFEPLCVAAVLALVIGRRAFLYKLLVDLLIVQIIVSAGLLILLLLFVLTWHAGMY